MAHHDVPLILASSSRYRRELLSRLALPFDVVSPEVDESPLADETPARLTARLAAAKVRAVAATHSPALIVGSDQAAEVAGVALSKPADYDHAVRQLERLSGNRVRFYTAVCLLDTTTNQQQLQVVPFDVVFRRLQRREIERYLEHEQPYDCTGSFRSEGLGVALTERLDGDDPSALIGLPLIRLCRMLALAGRPIL